MTLEPFKYLLQPVAIERDEGGRIVRELPGEVLAVFSGEAAAEAIALFESQLAEIQEANGASPSTRSHATADKRKREEVLSDG